MSIEALIAVMPPPENPPDANGDWSAVESALGLKLPSDYKALVTKYGRGQIGQFLGFYNPFSLAKYPNLIFQSHAQTSALRELKDAYPEDYPYPIYPDKGGLLPILQSDNGNIGFWLTEGESDTWKIVMYASRDDRCQVFDCGLTGFIVGVFAGDLTCSVFPTIEKKNPVDYRPDELPDPPGVELLNPGDYGFSQATSQRPDPLR